MHSGRCGCVSTISRTIERIIWLGTSRFDSSGSPVSGDVFLVSSQRSMAARSKVWPSHVKTGSKRSSMVMGQSREGITEVAWGCCTDASSCAHASAASASRADFLGGGGAEGPTPSAMASEPTISARSISALPRLFFPLFLPPRARSSSSTESPAAAACADVERTRMETGSLASSRRLTSSRFQADACSKAVWPEASRMPLRTLGASSSSRAISTSPAMEATIRGVMPSWSARLTSALPSRSMSTTAQRWRVSSSTPRVWSASGSKKDARHGCNSILQHAVASAVQPHRSCRLTWARIVSSSCTISMRPPAAAHVSIEPSVEASVAFTSPPDSR
mmetsp:Transcript_34782/g.59630  ORF Transcript_34782/g.59630 Transcript_34782/m.59630 type:complete len:334 (+) Transcript_34782:509-1510(+)